MLGFKMALDLLERAAFGFANHGLHPSDLIKPTRKPTKRGDYGPKEAA
jgi:hypothetical protein